ncbi:hypothetical protein HK18_04765 [Commensalibacter intestini]|uniref:Uncharacterized protein n=1 Tax=Commensalibacter intestini TaxID=479936 RepID=A0A251ZX22_9PROT|nr:hypothetical protein [Commensalibacter intestini]OUI79201.1 hypothetical protein HK18_04765 [Commensalibacter intestini]
MSKATIISAVVIVGMGAVGGGGYYYVAQQAEQKFQENINLIKSALPGSTLTYANHHISIFSQDVTMDKVVFKDDDGITYSADKVDIIFGLGNSLPKFIVDKVAIKEDGSDDNDVTVEHLELEDAKAEAGWIVIENGAIKKLYPSKISFDLLNIQNFEYREGSHSNFKIAQYQMTNYGLSKKTKITLKDLLITAGSDKFKLSAITLNQVNLAEMSQDQEALFNNNDIYTISTQELMKRYSETFAKLKFDLFSIDQLQYKKQYIGTLKLAHYDVKNYGFGRQSDQSLKGFSLVDGFGRNNYFKLASLDVNGVDFSLINRIYQNLNYTNYDLFMASFLAMQKDYIQQENAQKANISLTDLKSVFGDAQISLGSIKANVEVQQQGERQAIYSLDNLTFTLPKDYSNTQILTDLGYKVISVSGILREQYQLQTKLLSLSLDQLLFKDIGQVSATFKANIPVNLNYNNLVDNLQNPDVKFREFTLTMKSTGFIEKFIQQVSQEQGISEEEVKKNIVNSVKAGSVYLETMSPTFAGEVIKAANQWVQDPQKTEIKLTSIPTSPLNGASLAGRNEQETFDLLNMHIKAEPVN